MEQYLSRRLDQMEVIALMLDGVGFASNMVVVAMGITADGHKHPLGLRLGSTENKRLCIELLQDLQRRGLCIDERNGGKGLRWAIQAKTPPWLTALGVFGGLLVWGGGMKIRVQVHPSKSAATPAAGPLESYGSGG